MCEGDRLKNQAEAFEEMISEVPFRYRAGESKISILNRSPDVEISQEQPPGFSGILMTLCYLRDDEVVSDICSTQDKPDIILYGAKRKAITLIEEVVDKPSLSSAPVKNVTEWNCELCQVCTTSQDGLNDHLQGKKHKRKEATFTEHKDNKNWSIGLFPKESKFIQLVERHCDDMTSGKKPEEGSSSPNNNGPPSLLIDDNANDMRKNADHEKAKH
ncbi:hypothetical protein KY285_007570 [Solanum tuberosum]|nr:hypothetical protein KY285_007570 [Solanum tuberosum]